MWTCGHVEGGVIFSLIQFLLSEERETEVRKTMLEYKIEQSP